MSEFDDATLEAAAQLLERAAGNTLYEAAWRAGAKKIRALKKSKDSPQILKDGSHQISNSLSRPVA
jgi:uncharacterized protein with NAD-binding domain and iron-sulfur cluster